MTETSIPASGLLLLPRLRIQNANALAGPLSWGFPAPTAFTGFAHALERRLSELLPQGFGGVGIVCHGFAAQTSQPAGRRTQVFHLSRTPFHAGWKKFEDKASSLVEEGRVHLDITLVIAVRDEFDTDYERGQLTSAMLDQVQGMRLAGGSILPLRPPPKRHESPYWYGLPEGDQRDAFRVLRRRLLPGFALVQRDDLLRGRLAELQAEHPEATALDALLDLCRLNVEPGAALPDDPARVEWQVRKRPGWLVPLPVGYAGLSELHDPGAVANARDPSVPFRFVESLYSLGEWAGPHRLDSLAALLWHTQADPLNGIYRCVNHYAATLPTSTDQP